MIWFQNKTYTDDFFAAGLIDLYRLARASKRGMVVAAGGALLLMVAAHASLIYAL
ncbi:hypothetical protein [uncultured Pseudodesulfovibrio sp.]|uniref:hypothetical protein n=1 Tax=uncultured Pseudodesulfovibrio sp. TaxID=2035858 RepID=UPI0029C92DC5|nr:hypothetical protein [uncultured Pseudodesulfovibrio sp.]